jgi:succinate dehydrogenase/fumarate reductase flavoprotein subunit
MSRLMTASYDLVVLGSGAAGLSAALTAAVEGARVLVLEKGSLVGGTTSISGGAFWIPLNRHMDEVGVEDSREEALAYLRACAAGAGDDEILVALVDRGHEMVDFLEDRAGLAFRPWPSVGGTIDYRPWLEGAKHGGRPLSSGRFELATLGDWSPKIRLGMLSAWTMDPLSYYAERMHTRPLDPSLPMRAVPPDTRPEFLASGAALVGQLLSACLARGVEIRTETPADELVVDDGRVVGVRAAAATVYARRGVMVGTGGYGKNEELKRMWMSRPLHVTCEIDENQGDGQLLGMAVGAQLANLGDAWWMPQLAGLASAGAVNIAGTREERILPHTLMVNQRGHRFVNEALNYYDVSEQLGARDGGTLANLPAWLVFDRQGVEKYSTLALRAGQGEPDPWVIVAESLENLAARLGIDQDALTETVGRFNLYARSGEDLEFHRGESAWDIAWGDPNQSPNPSLGTVEKPPFYALEVSPGALATKGGLRVNERAEVLSARTPFEPIQGLYAAGNCSNAAVPGAYQGPGATIGAALTFGYIAGRELTA